MCENQIPMMPQEYDVKVREYGPGMIVWHTCPLGKADDRWAGARAGRFPLSGHGPVVEPE